MKLVVGSVLDGVRDQNPPEVRLTSATSSTGRPYTRTANGGGRIRTCEGLSQPVYSRSPLTAWVPRRGCLSLASGCRSGPIPSRKRRASFDLEFGVFRPPKDDL